MLKTSSTVFSVAANEKQVIDCSKNPKVTSRETANQTSFVSGSLPMTFESSGLSCFQRVIQQLLSGRLRQTHARMEHTNTNFGAQVTSKSIERISRQFSMLMTEFVVKDKAADHAFER
jgi:hypothetical protein